MRTKSKIFILSRLRAVQLHRATVHPALGKAGVQVRTVTYKAVWLYIIITIITRNNVYTFHTWKLLIRDTTYVQLVRVTSVHIIIHLYRRAKHYSHVSFSPKYIVFRYRLYATYRPPSADTFLAGATVVLLL